MRRIRASEFAQPIFARLNDLPLSERATGFEPRIVQQQKEGPSILVQHPTVAPCELKHEFRIVTSVFIMRKAFDVLAEGLLSKKVGATVPA
jgi:hypothetical protein